MTADGLREILDRFHVALQGIEEWAENARAMNERHPKANVDLHGIWCDLNRECVSMRQAERRIITATQKA